MSAMIVGKIHQQVFVGAPDLLSHRRAVRRQDSGSKRHLMAWYFSWWGAFDESRNGFEVLGRHMLAS